MNSLGIAAIAFACSAAGGAAGLVLRPRLPGAHLSGDAKEVIKLGTGLVGTMAALVLGLLVASATSAFDSVDDHFQRIATDFVLLDRGLAHYGPEAAEARAKLRVTIAAMHDRLWPPGGARPADLEPTATKAVGGAMFDAIRDLAPTTDSQKLIKAQAVEACADLARARLDVGRGSGGTVPTPFLVVLMFWLAALFAGFALLAEPNATVLAVILVCALSVSAALFLILDLDQPFDGLIRIDDEALRSAMAQVGK